MDALKDSNGFDTIQEKTGISKEKLLVARESNLKEYEEPEPKLSYDERKEREKEAKEKLEEEHNARMEGIRKLKEEAREN